MEPDASHGAVRKRRWFSIRFRTLLVLWLIVSLLLGTLGIEMHRANLQREAVQQIKQAFGSVLYDFEHEQLGGMSGLRRSEKTKISTESPVPKWISDRLGVDFWVEIAVVDLSVDTDPRYFKPPFGATRVIDDATLSFLEPLKSIQELDLTFQTISDEGVRRISYLKNLERLILQDTDITDEGLAHLQGLTRLKSLNVYNTKVTKKGATNFKKARPDCRIAWNFDGETWYEEN